MLTPREILSQFSAKELLNPITRTTVIERVKNELNGKGICEDKFGSCDEDRCYCETGN
mgnify:CR=1 FL=1